MRRLAGVLAAGVALALALPATPAHAAFSQAAWTAPTGVAPPTGGSDDWTATVDQRSTPQTVNLAGVFDHPNGVANVTLVVEQGEYDQPPCAPAGIPASMPGTPGGATSFSFDVLFPCNGTWVIRANAQSNGTLTQQPETTALRLALTVAVPAVPVERLRARATTDDAPKVVLMWEPVAETDRDPDFAGYDIERSVDGDDYEVISSVDPSASSFVDESPAATGGAHRYRVVSIRRAGADEDDGVVAASDAAPEAEADLPRTGDGGEEADGAGGGEGGTGGGSGGAIVAGRVAPSGVRRTYTPPSGGGGSSRTITTVDTGFQDTLPFDPNAQALPAGDPAVVAELEGDGDDTTKQTLALVAGGSAMFVGAVGVRRLLRKAASPYEVLQ